MKIQEKYCKLILITLLIILVLALFSVIVDYSGVTGNKGLSERGINTLILFLLGAPLVIITLTNRKLFTFFCKSLNYIVSSGKDGDENNRIQNLIRFLLFLSFCCAAWSVTDWVGITNSGLDVGGSIAIILFALFLLVSVFLLYFTPKTGKSRKTNRITDKDSDRNNNDIKFRLVALYTYSAIFILVVLSFFLFLKLPGNIITSVVMLIQIWAILMLVSQIIFIAFRLSRNLKINVSLSLTVFMSGILVIELFLRYVIATQTTYTERDGFFNYVSSFDSKREYEKDEYVERYYVHKPNSDCTINLTEFDYKLKTNSLGIRNKEITPKDSNEFRIICIGDSFTEGFGVDEEQCWPRILERELTKDLTGWKINVINAGSAGSDVVHMYTFLKEKLIKLAPDMVIACLNTSDISDIIARGGFQRFQSDNTLKYKSPPSWEPVYARSFIFRHIIHDFYRYDQFFIPENRVNAEMLNSIEVIDSALCKFKELSDKQYFKFVTVLHPYDFQITDYHIAYSELTRCISGIDGLHFFDMHDYFKNDCGLSQANIDEFCWKIDKHFNSKGYFLMAKGIEKYLLESGLLIKDSSGVN